MTNKENSFKISIVFDNRCKNDGFFTSFGFAALIYNEFNGKYVLFDTGGNSDVLIHNLKQFNINPSEIEKVVISHNHHDHAGGLNGIYKLNSNIEIYVPKSVESSYNRKFINAKIFGVSDSMEIDQNIYSSGQIGKSIKEQALLLKTRNNEIIILVGCAHPGLENFIMKAQEVSKVIAVIGGFHGFQKYSYLEGIDFIGACHCTQHIGSIQKRFPDQFKQICVGNSFSF